MWKGGGIGEAVTTQESLPSSGFARTETVGVIPMVDDRKEFAEDMETAGGDGGRTDLTTPLHQPPPTPHQPSPLASPPPIQNQHEQRNYRRSERSYTGNVRRGGGEEEFMAARKWMAPRNWDSPPTTPMTMTTTTRAENALPQQNPTQRRVRRKKRMEGALSGSGSGSGGSSNGSTVDVQGLGVVGVESLEEQRRYVSRGVRGYPGAT